MQFVQELVKSILGRAYDLLQLKMLVDSKTRKLKTTQANFEKAVASFETSEGHRTSRENSLLATVANVHSEDILVRLFVTKSAKKILKSYTQVLSRNQELTSNGSAAQNSSAYSMCIEHHMGEIMGDRPPTRASTDALSFLSYNKIIDAAMKEKAVDVQFVLSLLLDYARKSSTKAL